MNILRKFSDKIDLILKSKSIDEKIIEELEETLFAADVGELYLGRCGFDFSPTRAWVLESGVRVRGGRRPMGHARQPGIHPPLRRETFGRNQWSQRIAHGFCECDRSVAV